MPKKNSYIKSVRNELLQPISCYGGYSSFSLPIKTKLHYWMLKIVGDTIMDAFRPSEAYIH